MSAELCSLKAIESQQCKRLGELTHHLKQVELQSQQGHKLADALRHEKRDLERALSLAHVELG